jgi:hypothetical protein
VNGSKETNAMPSFKEQKIANETVVLDGTDFSWCQFEDCRMVYCGGELPRLQHCHFVRCSWHLEEAAQRSMYFLKSIYHSGPGGKDLVEQTLRQIRSA